MTKLHRIVRGEAPQMSDHKLTFRTSKSTGEVEVVMDKEGAELLLRALNRLLRKEKGISDHDHLFSPAWGGWQLTNDGTNDDKWQEVDHVKLYMLGGA